MSIARHFERARDKARRAKIDPLEALWRRDSYSTVQRVVLLAEAVEEMAEGMRLLSELVERGTR